MKGKTWDAYRMHYCSLCFGIRRRYGLIASLLLNYECVFLYIFLMSIFENERMEDQEILCPGNPFRRVKASICNPALDYAAFVNYHLAVLKFEDEVNDSKGLKRAICKVVRLWLSNNRKYQQSKLEHSNVAKVTTSLCRIHFCKNDLKT